MRQTGTRVKKSKGRQIYGDLGLRGEDIDRQEIREHIREYRYQVQWSLYGSNNRGLAEVRRQRELEVEKYDPKI